MNSFEDFIDGPVEERPILSLEDGSRIAVIGGGPAGSFFSYFLLKMAKTLDLDLQVEIFEPRLFAAQGPAGCNHCGGIVSESLGQILATEGINIPPNVVQRGIDSYILHMDVGSVRIDTPLQEKRIAAVYRGGGPRGLGTVEWDSFDRYLLELAVGLGASVVPKMVTSLRLNNGFPELGCVGEAPRRFDLVVGASGVNSRMLELFEQLGTDYKAPKTSRTYICEFHLGRERIQETLGTSMHVFLLDIPHLEFAALIPKGNCVTMCLLGQEIDEDLVSAFVSSPEVKACFPQSSGAPASICQCFPRINIREAIHPFADRVVMVGDCGVARLFKDGIGAAYKTSKAAATTAILHGIAKKDFERFYEPTCRAITVDNKIGKVVFTFSHQIQRMRFSRRAVLRMTRKEQTEPGAYQHMSTVLWDVFTGSAPYREVFLRTLHPGFVGRLILNLILGLFPSKEEHRQKG